MALNFDEISPYLPSYLTADGMSRLRDELRAFPNIPEFYLANAPAFTLQGDVWDRRHFVTTSDEGVPAARVARVMVISNTCDIAPENARVDPVKVLVAPLTSVARYRALQAGAGLDDMRIDDKIQAIQAQETTGIFYLPQGGGLEEDCLVLLDEIQAVRRDLLRLDEQHDRKATLSQVAFYLLLVKLSIHLCRAQENVDRYAA